MFPIRTTTQFILLLVFGLVINSCTSDSATSAATGNATNEAGIGVKVTEQLEVVYKGYPQVELLQEYLKPYPDSLTAVVPDFAVETKAAMAAYNAGQYQAAIDTFPNFSRKPELIGYIHLYKGISMLMEGKEHDAFLTFQLIRSKEQTAFEVSEWYRAICYLAYNNVYEARRKLEAIVANETYGKEEAAELLSTLPVK